MRTGAPTIPEDNGIPMTLLERYCAETATTGERAEVEAWFAAHPDTIGWSKTPEVDIVRRAYEIMGVFRPVDLTTGVDTQVTSARQPFSEMTGVGVPVLRRVRFKAQPLRRWIWYGGATVAIGVLGVLIGWHNGARQRFEPTVRPMSTYATTNGQRATITLLDGTTVVLGVASRLDVPGDFAAGNHQVALAGEALFTVLHHMGTPFTVLAGTSQTRVLGTSFVVRHYPHDTVTTVAVRDGKVIVDSAVVVARHLVLVGPHHQLDRRVADPAAFSFATGVLMLNVTPLPDAIPELDRWFDVDIRLGDPVLTKQRIVGRFTTSSAAELTHLFEMAYDVRVVRVGRVMTLFPRE